MVLETIGFDFRTRYPQKLLAKTIRAVLPDSSASDTSPGSFFATAYAMSIDMYRTFVPIKRTTFAMVSAVTELTALVLSPHPHGPEEEEEEEEGEQNGKRKREEEGEEDELVSKFRAFALRKHGPAGRHVVLETMLDILDLYVQHPKSTRLGATFDINHFMEIKIHLNQELEASSLSRHLGHCPRCEFAATAGSSGPPPPQRAPRQQQHAQNSVVTGNSSTQVPSRPANAPTMRFVFDPETAREERETADTFFKEEFEEYEIEVDEPIPPPPPAAPHAPRRERDEGGGGRGRRFHGGRGDHGRDRWGGGGGGHYRGDRRRGRRH
jgi:CTD kinase subunit beta